MTEIVFKPEKAKVENGRGLYRAWLNKKPLDLLFRAKTAGEADQMLQYLFAAQTKGKTLFVDPDLFSSPKEETHGNEEKQEKADTPAGDRPVDPPARRESPS